MSSHKTIAKNTLFLYFRMFLTMGVGLYTSSLILRTLGVIDYGIYGLVGGIVTSFAFINSAMVSATQRYLSFDIGKNDLDRLRQTFNATLNIHIAISVIVLILAETIGLWFLNNILDIPLNRLSAANWVYQFSIFAFILEIIQVPYNALLIAREHMSIYAYFSILETILKLVIVFILVNIHTDKLILYSVLTFVVIFIVRLIYKIYCKKHFEESIYQFYYDKSYYRELLNYSGWNLFGGLAMVARGQGSNILLNLFFGPVANAAFGITNMIQGIVGNFVNNFQVAVNPQIVKNYAKGETQVALDLIYKSAKFSFFGMLILIIPVMLNLNFLILIWLHNIPKYVVEFTQLALIFSLIESLVGPLAAGAQATGKIKWYQVIVGIFIFLVFPLTYVAFKIDKDPTILYWIFIANSFLALLFRLIFLRNMISLKLSDFFARVGLPICIVSIFSFMLIRYIFPVKPNDLITFIIQTAVVVLIVFFLIIIFGTSKGERQYGLRFIKSKLITDK